MRGLIRSSSLSFFRGTNASQFDALEARRGGTGLFSQVTEGGSVTATITRNADFGQALRTHACETVLAFDTPAGLVIPGVSLLASALRR